MNFLPLYILAAIHLFSLGMTIEAHGKIQKPRNAWDAIIGAIIIWGCLAWFILIN